MEFFKDKNYLEFFVEEISNKTARSQSDILAIGLFCTDFNSSLSIEFEDMSLISFKHAFYVKKDHWIGVFTEHCGYHVFDNRCITYLNVLN